MVESNVGIIVRSVNEGMSIVNNKILSQGTLWIQAHKESCTFSRILYNFRNFIYVMWGLVSENYNAKNNSYRST